MKNIYSNIFKFNKNSLFKVIYHLKKDEVIGLPTETVYGLAGNAYSKKSVRKIFFLKKRPKFNPLIVHYYNLDRASKDVFTNKYFFKLYKKFSPGPITYILKKKNSSKIDSLVSSNLKTIAIRFPANPKIRKILKKLNFPLAMPSANKSEGISPVDSNDVSEEFKKNIKIIIDDGRSNIGIESTVIDLTSNISILRPGSISKKLIEKTLNKKIKVIKNNKKIKSPGMLKKHYSPGIPMILNTPRPKKNSAFIAFGKNVKKNKNIFYLSKKANLYEAAKNLYKIFRKIKKEKYKKIYVAKIPNKGIGIAINDRLKHAAYNK
jgi:L-threonylcarbamoyladenylate synthase